MPNTHKVLQDRIDRMQKTIDGILRRENEAKQAIKVLQEKVERLEECVIDLEAVTFGDGESMPPHY